jgi:hypothetical protein
MLIIVAGLLILAIIQAWQIAFLESRMAMMEDTLFSRVSRIIPVRIDPNERFD